MKNILLESFFQSAGKLKYLFTFVRTFSLRKYRCKLCIVNFKSENGGTRVNGPKSYCRPVVSLPHASKSFCVNRP